VVPDALATLANAIGQVLQRVFLLNPDYFVCASVWAQPAYRRMLCTVFQDRAKSLLSESKSDSEAAIQDILANFGSVAARNDGLLFKTLPERTVVDMRATIADVQVSSLLSFTRIHDR
jgi:hypothetical protein